VIGHVATPTLLVHHNGLRMTEALSAAGGLTRGGDKSDIRLMRGPPEAPKTYRASLRGIVDGHQHDVALAPGDVVFVTDDPIEDFGEIVRVAAPMAVIGLAILAVTLIVTQ
jgi:protein involved in polysaccharide export with SLBB domain